MRGFPGSGDGARRQRLIYHPSHTRPPKGRPGRLGRRDQQPLSHAPPQFLPWKHAPPSAFPSPLPALNSVPMAELLSYFPPPPPRSISRLLLLPLPTPERLGAPEPIRSPQRLRPDDDAPAEVACAWDCLRPPNSPFPSPGTKQAAGRPLRWGWGWRTRLPGKQPGKARLGQSVARAVSAPRPASLAAGGKARDQPTNRRESGRGELQRRPLPASLYSAVLNLP